MKAAIILANSGKLDKTELKSYDLIIGADRGALNALNQGIIPNKAIGDFDSVTDKERDFIYKSIQDIRKLNPIKDKTDTDEAIDLCNGFDSIMIYGGIQGRRIEHFYSNIIQLYNHKNLKMKDENSLIETKEESFIPDSSYKFISVFSLTDESILSIDGMKYNLDHYKMLKNDPLGVSNECVNNPYITIHQGRILLISTKDDHEEL